MCWKETKEKKRKVKEKMCIKKNQNAPGKKKSDTKFETQM